MEMAGLGDICWRELNSMSTRIVEDEGLIRYGQVLLVSVYGTCDLLG